MAKSLAGRLSKLEQQAAPPVPTTRTVWRRWGEPVADALARQPGTARRLIALPAPMTPEEWEARAVAQQKALIDDSR